ncbi:MAG: hypothetical protein AAGD86_06385 [Pseudomonadota bacterium]
MNGFIKSSAERTDPARRRASSVLGVALLLILAGCASGPVADSDRQAVHLDAAQQALGIERGIVFNELGDFTAAMDEFSAVLAANPDNVDALYEAALTRYATRDFRECADLAGRGAALASPRKAAFELLLGNALDETGATDHAVAAYRRSIALDGSDYLAHFNLAVTLARANDTVAARRSVQRGLTLKPQHASSHLLLARLYHYDGFRVPAILAYARFLELEARTERSAEAADALQTLLATGASVSRTDAQVTLSLLQANPDVSEGNFKEIDLALSVLQGLQKSGDEARPNEAEQIAERFGLLFGMLSDTHRDGGNAGFAWEFYAPYFAAIETMDFTRLVTYFTLRARAIPEVDTWLDDNHGKVNRFLAWSADWQWLSPAESPEPL